MNYLYGDSTPSPLKSNFLEFFRDALDCSVYLLQADCRIKLGKERARTLRDEAGVEMQRLHAFVQTVLRAINGVVPKGAPDSPTTQCATRLTAMSMDALTTALGQVKDQLARSLALTDAEEAAQRAGCTKALAILLAPHDPSDGSSVTHVELGGSGAYELSVKGEAKFGLGWTFALAIPEQHLWSAPLFLDRIYPQFEIRTPQLSGWLTKEVKVRPQKIERHIVTQLVDDGKFVRIALRAEPGAEAGFDLEVDPEAKAVGIVRVGAKEDSNGPFEVQSEDVPRLLELTDRLRAAAGELKRAHLVSATVAGGDFQALPTFVGFTESLIAMMAPIAREISDRSLSSTELVIRRLLSNDRREEVFVTKSSLRDKYAPLPENLRALFGSLGLEATAPRGLSLQAPPQETEIVRSELPPSMPPPPPVEISVPPAGFEGPASDGTSVPGTGLSTPDRASVPGTARSKPAGTSVPGTAWSAPDGTLPGTAWSAPDGTLPGTGSTPDGTSVPGMAWAPEGTSVPGTAWAAPDGTSAPGTAWSTPEAGERVTVAMAPPLPTIPDTISDAFAKQTAEPPPIVAQPPRTEERHDALVAALKLIVSLAKKGSIDEAYNAYAALFWGPVFEEHRPEDQRQALKLMLTRPTPATMSEAVLDAHRAAIMRLQALVERFDDPADYELLGMAHLTLKDTAAASATFSTALALERKRNPESDLCGNLTRRVAAL